MLSSAGLPMDLVASHGGKDALSCDTASFCMESVYVVFEVYLFSFCLSQLMALWDLGSRVEPRPLSSESAES